MRIVIRLGGHTLPWRFREGDRLGDWVASRPWHDRSEVRIVRLAGAGAVAPVFDAVQQAVVGADQGATEIQSLRLNPQQVAEGGFECSLARRLGVSVGADRYAMLQAVGRCLADRPCLCLVPPLPVDRPQAAQDAEAGVDLLSKVVPGARACVLLADLRDRPLAGVAFDLTTGAPAAGLGLAADPADGLWARYLHVRLAWEAGGDPCRAEAIISTIGRIDPGEDGALERGLNSYARSEWARLSEGLRRRIAERRGGVRGHGHRARDEAVRDPAAAGLYWQPGEPAESMPAPWLARALLLAQSDGAGTEFLRGCLVCVPLAQELVMACLQLEARERGRLIACEDRDAGPEAREHWDRFQHGESLTYTLYPPACPAAPRGPWSFASFGQVLREFNDGAPWPDPRYRLLELRNHLAHGHYVGWKAVLELMDVRRLLALKPA
jgi:hypothetical protein